MDAHVNRGKKKNPGTGADEVQGRYARKWLLTWGCGNVSQAAAEGTAVAVLMHCGP